MKKNIKFLPVFISCLLAFSSVAYAHGGRTDAYGGHRDNNNVSGLGSYHYHHGYSAHLHPNGICPYSAKPSVSAPSTTTTKPASPTTPITNPSTPTTTTTTTTKPTVPSTTTTSTPAVPMQTTNTTAYAKSIKEVAASVRVNDSSLTGPFLSYNNTLYVPLYQIANSISAVLNTDITTNSYTMTHDTKSWYMDEFVIFIPLESDTHYHKFDCPIMQQNGLHKYLSMDIGFAKLGLIDSVSPCPYCIY